MKYALINFCSFLLHLLIENKNVLSNNSCNPVPSVKVSFYIDSTIAFKGTKVVRDQNPETGHLRLARMDILPTILELARV